MAPYVSVNSSAFCEQNEKAKTKQIRAGGRVDPGVVSDLLRSKRGGGAGSYDALDAAEEGVPGLGPRERRHLPDRAAPLAGGDRSSSAAVVVMRRRERERDRGRGHVARTASL